MSLHGRQNLHYLALKFIRKQFYFIQDQEFQFASQMQQIFDFPFHRKFE
jgi:hypothetical protein